jgi:hypothetical protein
MPYLITARKPGATLTYRAATEEAALRKVHELRAAQMRVAVVDESTNAEVDDVDLEDRIDARGDDA